MCRKLRRLLSSDTMLACAMLTTAAGRFTG